jgi:hypothetical protein
VTENTTIPENVRELENYYEELKWFSWEPAPYSAYAIEKECDL